MTNMQIQSVKSLCGRISKMQYTQSYKITEFKVVENDKDIEVRYTITRNGRLADKPYVVKYYGLIYVTPKGKEYVLTTSGNKKSFKYISQTVYKEENITEKLQSAENY